MALCTCIQCHFLWGCQQQYSYQPICGCTLVVAGSAAISATPGQLPLPSASLWVVE